jgi:N-acetylglucosamine-6-phosphate deacetylase
VSLLVRGAAVLVGTALVPSYDVVLDDGVVVALGEGLGTPDLEVATVSPGFVDLHVHALDGCGFIESPDLVGLSTALVKRGVTSFLATTITASPAALLSAVEVVAAGGGPARCRGVHLEGPWLSPVRAGAQPVEHLRAPSVPELEALVAAGPVRLVTLAPELPGADALIAAAVDLGVRVSLGHSDCSFSAASQALALGATHVTHCFNAMSGFHHREPGLVGAALDLPLTVEVIADGVHVHPSAVRSLVAAAGRDRVCLVSDAVDTGVPGSGAVRLADGTLAGTRAGVDAGVRNLVSWGVPLADALGMAAVTPLSALGLAGGLAVGAAADLVLLTSDLAVEATVVAGQVVWQR